MAPAPTTTPALRLPEAVLGFQVVGLVFASFESAVRRLAYPSEHHMVLKQVFATLASAGTLVGALVGGLVYLVHRLKARPQHVYPMLGALTALPVGVHLSSGRWISHQWFAPLVAPVFAAAVGAVLWLGMLALALLAGWVARCLVLLALAVVLVAADSHLMVGLYPVLHDVLFACVWIAGGLAVATALQRLPSPGSRLSLVGSVLLASSVPLAWVKSPNNAHREIWSRSESYARRVHDRAHYAYWRAIVGLSNSDGYARPLAIWLRSQPRRDELSRPRAEAAWHRAIRQRPRTAAAPAAQGQRPDIILVTVDTLRADVASEPTPDSKWQRIAERGRSFDRAFAHASTTRLSLPRLVTGELAPNENGSNLVRALRAHGYETIWITPRRAHEWLMRQNQTWLRDFHVRHATALAQQPSSEAITSAAISRLRAPRSKPLFLWVHYFDVHEWQKLAPPTSSNATDLERYRSAWLATESHVATLVSEIMSLGSQRSAVAVLTADHGEYLDRPGRTGHGPWLDLELVHVPLVVFGLGIAPAEIGRPVGLHDVAPTIAEFARVTYSCHGVSLMRDDLDPLRPIVMAEGSEIGIVRGARMLLVNPTAGVMRVLEDGSDAFSKGVPTHTASVRKDLLLPLLGSPMALGFGSPLEGF